MASMIPLRSQWKTQESQKVIGLALYEVNEKPGGPASIWWMWTEVKDGTLTFTYDPNKNF